MSILPIPNPSRGHRFGTGLNTIGTHWAAIRAPGFLSLGLRVGHGEAAWRVGPRSLTCREQMNMR